MRRVSVVMRSLLRRVSVVMRSLLKRANKKRFVERVNDALTVCWVRWRGGRRREEKREREQKMRDEKDEGEGDLQKEN